MNGKTMIIHSPFGRSRCFLFLRYSGRDIPRNYDNSWFYRGIRL